MMIMRIGKLLCAVAMSLNGFAQGNADAKKYAHGREYHVSVTGSDANNGSISKPLKTISAAANLAMPGDTITVHAGIYREQVVPPRGGNAGNERILYRAAPGEKVDIRGSEEVKGWRKMANDTWMLSLPNTFFGKFNPYREYIHGDWFWPNPKNRKYLRGEVYLNGHWLQEGRNMDEVMQPAVGPQALWCAMVDADSTRIWAQFKDQDPNRETTEINVRENVFYPDKPFIHYLTVRGFTMQHAATNWAPPTAEQQGLIGTHWSRGWIIENNTIQYSKCVGIALGKYGDAFDNKDTESAEGYVGTIKRGLAFGWNKGTVGSHIVRNNKISYCEQTGIVGSMGCAFSVVEQNVIHDIHMRRMFNGAEMAGIKFHGAVDVLIQNNRIYRTNMGIWLDWMAQGAQVKNNLMHDNDLDIFLEVNHGPTLVSNNILLSKTSLLMNSSGAAFVHNLFAGKMTVVKYDSRLTPYHLPHSTEMDTLHDNPGGDIQFINNLFVDGADAGEYSKSLLPVRFSGNVYTKGVVRAVSEQGANRFGEMGKDAQEKMKSYKEQAATETEVVNAEGFDASAKLIAEGEATFLEINLDKSWLTRKRKLVTTQTLDTAMVSHLPFENTDGAPLKIDSDYSDHKRNISNPSPGPFEIRNSGKQKIKVW